MTTAEFIIKTEWDPFPSNRTRKLNINGLTLSECSESLSRVGLLRSATSIEITRDDKTQGIKGKLILEPQTVDQTTYDEMHIIQTCHQKNVGYSRIADDCKMILSFVFCENTLLEHYFEIPVDIQEVKIECTSKGDTKITDYYLNAPNVSASYCKDSILICNDDDDDTEECIPIPLRIQGHVSALGAYKFGLWNGFNISGCRNSAYIEYHQDTPDDFRQMVQDFTSYLFGSKTIRIAEKIQKDDNLVIRSFSPGEESRYFDCRESCPFDKICAECFFGELFNKYLLKFSEIYERYQIHRFLTSYWRALSSPKETAVLLFQIANDIVIEAFNKDTNKEYIITKKKMMEKFGEEINTLENKITKELGPTGTPIINSIENSIIMSRSKLIEEFNNNLSISISDSEKKLIKNTNKIRHGNEMSEKEIKNGYLFHLTYCNRIILSLMGEKTHYYDYAAHETICPGNK